VNNFNLTKLIKKYSELSKGYLVDNPNSLNFICKIFDICDVYISNKALKHIVESRRDKDFMNVDEITNVVKVFGIILLDPDVVFINQNRLNSIGVCKNLNSADSLGIILILECVHVHGHYEIITSYEKDNKRIQRLINIKHLIK
jgi:hypothetical protein